MATRPAKSKAAPPKASPSKTAAPKPTKPARSKPVRLKRSRREFVPLTPEEREDERKRYNEQEADAASARIERMIDRLFGRLDTTRAVEQLGGLLRDIYTSAGLMEPGKPGLRINVAEFGLQITGTHGKPPPPFDVGPFDPHSDTAEETAAVAREVMTCIRLATFGVDANNQAAEEGKRELLIEEQAKVAPSHVTIGGLFVPAGAIDTSLVSALRNGQPLDAQQRMILILAVQSWASGEAWARQDMIKAGRSSASVSKPMPTYERDDLTDAERDEIECRVDAELMGLAEGIRDHNRRVVNGKTDQIAGAQADAPQGKIAVGEYMIPTLIVPQSERRSIVEGRLIEGDTPRVLAVALGQRVRREATAAIVKLRPGAEAQTTTSQFTCPSCLGHTYGTAMGNRGRQDMGCCHGYLSAGAGHTATPCRFSWPRSEFTDRMYGILPPEPGAGGTGQVYVANPPREGEGLPEGEPKASPLATSEGNTQQADAPGAALPDEDGTP